MGESDKKVSKFSSGLNIVMRLDELWKDTHKHSREGRYSSWNLDLDRIWLELARDLDELKDKEKGESKVKSFESYQSEFNAFDKDLAAQGRFTDQGPVGFQVLKGEEVTKRGEHYKVLMKKQLFLARIENKLGKGTTYNEGDDDDFD